MHRPPLQKPRLFRRLEEDRVLLQGVLFGRVQIVQRRRLLERHEAVTLGEAGSPVKDDLGPRDLSKLGKVVTQLAVTDGPRNVSHEDLERTGGGTTGHDQTAVGKLKVAAEGNGKKQYRWNRIDYIRIKFNTTKKKLNLPLENAKFW